MWDILLGGITGLIGTIWSSYNQRKIKELEIADKREGRSHELDMLKAETEAMRAEADASIKVTQAQVEGEVAVAEIKAFSTSQRVGNASVFLESFMERIFSTTGWVAYFAHPVGVLICLLFGVVDTIKSLARPGITAYLLGISTWVTVQAWTILNNLATPITSVQAAALFSDVVQTVLYLTVSSVTWWFGDRMTSKGMARVLKSSRGGK